LLTAESIRFKMRPRVGGGFCRGLLLGLSFRAAQARRDPDGADVCPRFPGAWGKAWEALQLGTDGRRQLKRHDLPTGR